MSEETAPAGVSPAVEYCYDIGTLVVVAYRIIIGKPNKPGGVGRIKSRSVNGDDKIYSVVYVLGGKEENIQEHHISLAAQSIAPRERKKAEVYQPDIVQSPKRRKIMKKAPLEEKQQQPKKKRTEKKGQGAGTGSSAAVTNACVDMDSSHLDQTAEYESDDEVVMEEEQISDEVYELAVVIYHEARRRADEGQEEIDLQDIKEMFQIMTSGANAKSISDSNSTDATTADSTGSTDDAVAATAAADEDDNRMVVTPELFDEALEYLTKENKIMVCDMLLYFI